MTPSPRIPQRAVLIALAILVAAVSILSIVGGDNLQASVTAPGLGAARDGKQAPRADPGERMARLLERLERRRAGQSEAFQVPDWNPPLPSALVLLPQPPPPPPPKPAERTPEAPPLPFVYIGHMEVKGRIEVFLGDGPDGISVKAGDTVRDNYRVDRITGQAVTFTHLPTGIQQTLEISPQY